MNRAYLSYIHYMHSNHELNEYLAKICMHSLLGPLVRAIEELLRAGASTPAMPGGWP